MLRSKWYFLEGKIPGPDRGPERVQRGPIWGSKRGSSKEPKLGSPPFVPTRTQKVLSLIFLKPSKNFGSTVRPIVRIKKQPIRNPAIWRSLANKQLSYQKN